MILRNVDTDNLALKFTDPKVAQVFDNYPTEHRDTMLELRKLIFAVAASIKEVGPLEETLKWGEPAYLTNKTGSGVTIRIDWKPKNPDCYAMYFNCQTTLIGRFRTQFANEFDFEGNRAILFPVEEPLPTKALSSCIAAALIYHQSKEN